MYQKFCADCKYEMLDITEPICEPCFGKKSRPNWIAKGTEEIGVYQPPHYTAHPSGVECIEITETMDFCLGNAIKYIWRAGLKGGQETLIKDLKKAIWYIERRIQLEQKYKGSQEKIK